MSALSPIRLAVLGTGGMAASHVRCFKEIPGVEVVASCDIRADAGKEFAERHGIPAFYPDHRTLLERETLDAVSIGASDAAHCELAVAALRRGLHVFCEKPLATSVVEARRMLQTARRSGKMHMINFTYREMTALDRARQLVEDGAIGRVLHVEASYLQSWLANDVWGDWRTSPKMLWRLSRAHGGGTLADIGCHIIDFVMSVAGDIRKVGCMTRRYDKGVRGGRCGGYKLDADDSFILTAEFASGALGVIHSTRWATGHRNTQRLRLFGDKGGISIDSDEGWDVLRVCIGELYAKEAVWTPIKVASPRVRLYQRFIESIRAGRPTAPTFEEGCKVQIVMDACRRSAESGREVRLTV